MPPNEIIAAFERTAPLVVDLMRAQRGEALKPLVIEAKTRLAQSTMLLRDFREVELKYSAREAGIGGCMNGRID